MKFYLKNSYFKKTWSSFLFKWIKEKETENIAFECPCEIRAFLFLRLLSRFHAPHMHSSFMNFKHTFAMVCLITSPCVLETLHIFSGGSDP